jgi:hypothetical protein
MHERTPCLLCNKPMSGRIDKKYCSDGCRSEAHNQKNRLAIESTRRINATLQRNRNILDTVLGNAKDEIVSEHELQQLGFMFDYVTRIGDFEGVALRFCYDLVYYQHTETSYAITRSEKP